MCRSSLADQEFNNIQVVVMDGHMKGCQTVLLSTHAHTRTDIETHTKQKHVYMKHIHDKSSLRRPVTTLWRLDCFCVLQGEDCLTFPAALGLAPLSRRRSATSTFPYLEATWRGVKPFCSNDRERYSMFVSVVGKKEEREKAN